jgi:hypothetical protein
MGFRMKVEDMFRIGEKTVFAGQLDAQAKIIANVSCVIEIDGEPSGRLRIEGEVHTGKAHRDLWTTSPVCLNRNILRNHEVWLISEQA